MQTFIGGLLSGGVELNDLENAKAGSNERVGGGLIRGLIHDTKTGS